MGLLDDAIREHLELKRLRGADPDEVARLEREALGPPHRRAEVHAESLAHDGEEDGAPSARHDESPAAPAFYDDELDREGRHSLPATAQDTEEHDMEAELYAEPPHDPLHREPEEEHPLPDAPREGGPGEEEGDVLEETPDFLQQAPEHDRLWFEQQPPRDFDFDK